MSVSKPARRLLWFAVIFLVLIGVAAVTRSSLVLIWPQRFSGSSSNPAAALDAGFARHVALTFIHILPGALFLALAPFQFVPNVRQKHLQFHRWMGRVLVFMRSDHRSLCADHELQDEHRRTERNGGHHAIRDRISDLSAQGLPAHSTQGSRAPSRVDDSRLRRRAGSGHDATDCRNVLCVSQAHAA